MKIFIALIFTISLIQSADISKIEIWYQAKNDVPYYQIIENGRLKEVGGSHVPGQYDFDIALPDDAVKNIKWITAYNISSKSVKIDDPESAIKLKVTYDDSQSKEVTCEFKGFEDRKQNSIYTFFEEMELIIKYLKPKK